jgi:Ca-activated chloride channel family protein
MRFEAPGLLVFLVAVPLAVAAYIWFESSRDARASAWAPRALLANMMTRPAAWRRHLPTALLLVGTTLLLVGFARPQATVHVKRQDATLILVLDVSGSMAAKDMPPSRLAAVRSTAERLLDRLPHGYRAAVVTFSDHAAVVAPPTHDLARVRLAIEHAKSGPQGTAVADAVARAVAVAQTVRTPGTQRRPPAAIVLLSDGGQTAGRVTPQQAAQRARRAGVPVSAGAVGTPDGIVEQKLQGGFTERIAVPVQPAVLQTIAQGSGGRFSQRLSAVSGSAIYRELGSRVGRRPKRIEVTAAATAGGLVFMLAGAVLSGAWFRRIPA